VYVRTAIAQCNESASVSAELVDKLINQMNYTIERIKTYLTSTESSRVDTAVIESYELGLKMVEEAKHLKEVGNCSEAADSAVQAIKHFKEALIRAEEYIPSEVPMQIRETVEENLWFRTTLKRAQAYLERLREAVRRFAEEGHDVTMEEEVLDKLEGFLETACQSLDSGNFSTAKRAYTAARDLIIKIKGYMENLIKKNKEARLERYLNHAQSRIEIMDTKISRLTSNLEAEKVIQVRAVLDASNAKIINYKERLAEGMVEKVIKDLKNTVVEIDDSLDTFDGNGTSLRLKAINELEAKLQVLRITLVWLTNEGRNTTRIQMEIHRIQTLIESMIEEMEKGNNITAQELLEDASTDLTASGTLTRTRTRIVDRIKAYITEKIEEAEESTNTTLSPTN
jgi:hypothetical protein